jgi:hypothetical protein
MEPLIGTDYNWMDKEQPEDILKLLIKDHAETEALEQQAEAELLNVIAELTK